METLHALNPLARALSAGVFAWAMSALGAALIFAARGFNRKFFDMMLGFAAGVMLAAVFWSLLEPAIRMSGASGAVAWFPAAAGFLLGAAVLRAVDRLLPHLHLGLPGEEAEGVSTSWSRSVLLVLAITLHNIPEGLALGVAAGASAPGMPGAPYVGALALTIGIGIHNIPEGFAVAAAVRREGFSRARSFRYGQLSAAVYPVASAGGFAAAVWMGSFLPYALAFAGGAMVFVVVEEVIPESQAGGNTDLATAGTILGFVGMMVLEAVLH